MFIFAWFVHAKPSDVQRALQDQHERVKTLQNRNLPLAHDSKSIL